MFLRYIRIWLVISYLFTQKIVLAATPAEIGKKVCDTNPGAPGCVTNLLGANSVFTKGIGVILFLLGAISVIMIIIGGLRYTLSGGDAAGVKSAKDTILYALVGLVVAIFAFAIVAFVIERTG